MKMKFILMQMKRHKPGAFRKFRIETKRGKYFIYALKFGTFCLKKHLCIYSGTMTENICFRESQLYISNVRIDLSNRNISFLKWSFNYNHVVLGKIKIRN